MHGLCRCTQFCFNACTKGITGSSVEVKEPESNKFETYCDNNNQTIVRTMMRGLRGHESWSRTNGCTVPKWWRAPSIVVIGWRIERACLLGRTRTPPVPPLTFFLVPVLMQFLFRTSCYFNRFKVVYIFNTLESSEEKWSPSHWFSEFVSFSTINCVVEKSRRYTFILTDFIF